jgi:hypothetical protein
MKSSRRGIRNWFIIIPALLFFAQCKSVFQKEEYLSLMISDTDTTYSAVQIKGLEGKYVLLALIKELPLMTQITDKDILEAPFSISKIENGVIDVRLYETINYWTEKGVFWVVFFLPDPSATKVSSAYMSKDPHDISATRNYLSNNDFMPPFKFDIDLSGIVPF